MLIRPTVAFFVELSSAYGRGLLWGLRGYNRRHANWNIVVPDHRQISLTKRSLRDLKCDGVIARIQDAPALRIAQSLGAPIVNVGAPRFESNIPSVHTDDRLVACMAFEHLYDHGFRRFACCGSKGHVESELRRAYFSEVCQGANAPCDDFEIDSLQPWQTRLTLISRWLNDLPRPIAILATHDGLGREVLDACCAVKIAVPQDVAVIGVDNDELICELSDPQLSSVAPDIERIGFQAAQQLEGLMQNNAPTAATDTLIQPIRVIPRRSTDALAIEDPDIAAAVRYIRKHAVEGIKVADVLAAVPISRRVLETSFRTQLGRTPHQEILRIQLGHVKTLLRETELPLNAIASRCGFRHTEYMSVVFKRETGQTPSAYRQEWR